MAWTASGLYVLNFIDVFDATQLAIDLSLTSHKIAMYNNTETPNFSTEVGYSVTNEVTGTGYTAGGQVVITPTLTTADVQITAHVSATNTVKVVLLNRNGSAVDLGNGTLKVTVFQNA